MTAVHSHAKRMIKANCSATRVMPMRYWKRASVVKWGLPVSASPRDGQPDAVAAFAICDTHHAAARRPHARVLT